jgi:hypothetical protein
MHQTNHYNTAGKLDYIDQYIDRHRLWKRRKECEGEFVDLLICLFVDALI